MMTDSNNKLILLDADVLSHFCKAGKILLLVQMFSTRLVLLDIVKDELCRLPFLKSCVDTLIEHFNINQLIVTDDIEIYGEYSNLEKTYGRGESACMAYARKSDDIIASSNLTDIRIYCQKHGIEYMTTMDILLIARLENYLNERECDEFISRVKKRSSKLPCDSISDYESICDPTKVARLRNLTK